MELLLRDSKPLLQQSRWSADAMKRKLRAQKYLPALDSTLPQIAELSSCHAKGVSEALRNEFLSLLLP